MIYIKVTNNMEQSVVLTKENIYYNKARGTLFSIFMGKGCVFRGYFDVSFVE